MHMYLPIHGIGPPDLGFISSFLHQKTHQRLFNLLLHISKAFLNSHKIVNSIVMHFFVRLNAQCFQGGFCHKASVGSHVKTDIAFRFKSCNCKWSVFFGSMRGEGVCCLVDYLLFYRWRVLVCCQGLEMCLLVGYK